MSVNVVKKLQNVLLSGVFNFKPTGQSSSQRNECFTASIAQTCYPAQSPARKYLRQLKVGNMLLTFSPSASRREIACFCCSKTRLMVMPMMRSFYTHIGQ